MQPAGKTPRNSDAVFDDVSDPASAAAAASPTPPTPTRTRRRRRWITAGVVGVLLLAAYIGASLYTSRPAFCNVCHEMGPYYTAWQEGPHADTSCVECHVDPGVLADFAHKFVALHEVWVHFTGNPAFPMPDVDLPDERCLHCHDETIDPGIEGFDHEEHRNGRTCKSCHTTTGHEVTAEALAEAGILNADVQAQRDAAQGIVAGNGTPLDGHVAVGCSQCHDMPASTCAACHEPPEEHPQRPCMNCHAPDTWEFTHPDATAICVLCHERPPGHRDGECSVCHTPGEDWTFVHPTSTDCGACHTPPADHYAGSCASCHSPGTPFEETVFAHPGESATCTDCHSAPSNHYGTSCASCHSPSQPWSSGALSHPAIPGGEHTYRSFECVKCHPNGYGSATCTACHENGAPDDDD